MNNWFNKLRQRIQLMAHDPAAEMSRGGQTVAYLFELCKHGFRELKHDKAGQMAAALTYHTLFSLLPTLVITLVILAAFVDDAQREEFKKDLSEIILPIAGAEEAPPPPSTTIEGETLATGREDTNDEAVQLAAKKKQEFEEARKAIDKQIQSIFTQLEGVSFRGIGAVGILIFIYGATGLLASIEKSFNLIFGANKPRPWFLRIPLYWTVITLGPLVLLAGQVAQANFLAFIENTPVINVIGGIASYISPIFTTWLVLTLMFTLLPNTRVRFRAAMIGGLVAAVLWVAAIEGLAIFVRNAASASVYGALFLLPLFLMWLWITWLIILFGLEVTHAVQAMKSRQFKHMDYAADDLLVEPAWLLPVIAVIARRFAIGKTVTAERVTAKTGLALRSVENMLDKLENAHLIRHIDDADATGYVLARPASAITAADILAVGQTMLAPRTPSGSDPAWLLVDQLHADNQSFTNQTTLDQLIKRSPDTDD